MTTNTTQQYFTCYNLMQQKHPALRNNRIAELAFTMQQGQGMWQEFRVLRKLSYCAAGFPSARPCLLMFIIPAEEELEAKYEN